MVYCPYSNPLPEGVRKQSLSGIEQAKTAISKDRLVNQNRKLRFAVVGCGMLARSQHIPNLAASPRAVLHTCCDLDDTALAECRDRFGALRISKDFKAVIADPDIDAVCLAATERLRLPVIEAAAAAGKPVYVEKPLARTLAEVYQIRDAVRQSGIPFCVGHNRRSSPAMIDAHAIFRGHMSNPQPCPWRYDREGDERPRMADDGVAGMSVRINDDWHSWKNWVFDKQQAPHGPMLFEMTHFTDICNWLLAAEPVEVMAMEHGLFNHSVGIRYRAGEMATISMSCNGSFGYPKELYEVMGHGGVLAIDHMVEIRTAGIAGAPDRRTYPLVGDRLPDVGGEGGLYGWLAKRRAGCQLAVEKGDPTQQFVGDADKGHAAHLNRFIGQILDGGEPVCGIDDAVLATEVAFAAVASAHARRVVTLDEVRQSGGVSV